MTHGELVFWLEFFPLLATYNHDAAFSHVKYAQNCLHHAMDVTERIVSILIALHQIYDFFTWRFSSTQSSLIRPIQMGIKRARLLDLQLNF